MCSARGYFYLQLPASMKFDGSLHTPSTFGALSHGELSRSTYGSARVLRLYRLILNYRIKKQIIKIANSTSPSRVDVSPQFPQQGKRRK